MKNPVRLFVTFFLVSNLFYATPSLAADPPVKKSKSGICHTKGSTYFSRTKNYSSYNTMEKCLKSGGRKPKK
ncbi:hypothetical protein [Marinomonas primoryensis]|jgi:hypothetical protein|uniref:hypothetical protein n=1 Tax=Marinomonas primoryensis TaxID=178399 RepID=UPI0030DB4FBE|tara:strand:+ start:1067 stop:1282 length:216 start_codon:yes stop_codon:yes gene_type:complete